MPDHPTRDEIRLLDGAFYVDRAVDARGYLFGHLLKGVTRHDPTDKLREVPFDYGVKMSAQEIGDKLVDAGVTGILNFAPKRLHLPPHVYVEHVDLTTSMEKVAYFVQSGHKSTDPDA